MSSIDENVGKTNAYFATLTSSTDFTDDHEQAIIEFHRQFDSVFLVVENHADGKPHYHAVFRDPRNKQTAKVTLKYERFYAANEIEYTKGISVIVKRVSELIGTFHYLSKDLPPDQPPLLIRGWRMSWIKETCLKNLKKMPHKMLMGDSAVVKPACAVDLCCQFAKRANILVDSKFTFGHLIKAMIKDGYLFHNVKLKILFVHVMARLGHDHWVDAWVDNELRFLE